MSMKESVNHIFVYIWWLLLLIVSIRWLNRIFYHLSLTLKRLSLTSSKWRSRSAHLFNFNLDITNDWLWWTLSLYVKVLSLAYSVNCSNIRIPWYSMWGNRLDNIGRFSIIDVLLIGCLCLGSFPTVHCLPLIYSSRWFPLNLLISLLKYFNYALKEHQVR